MCYRVFLSIRVSRTMLCHQQNTDIQIMQFQHNFMSEILHYFDLKPHKKCKAGQIPILFYDKRRFESHQDNFFSLIQHCERRELSLHFVWTKVNKKCQKSSILASFWKPEPCGQTVLPDRPFIIGQKWVENAKIPKFKCDILGDFQTLCKK